VFAHYPVVLLVLLSFAACASPYMAPPGGEPSVPALEETYFLTSDGRRLPLRMWLPQEMETAAPQTASPKVMPKAVIGALHGFNDYSSAFETTGTFLARRGIATFAFDQRGFGAGPQIGLWAGGDAMANDARDFAAALRQRYPETPLFLLGESMGAAVVMVAMTGGAGSSLAAAVDGAILLAPAIWARETMNPFQVGLLWLAAHTLPAVTLTGRGLHIRASDNNVMLRALSADPLIIKETRVDTIYGLTNLMDAALASSGEAMGAPVLILYGQRDEIIPLKPVRALLERLPHGAGLDGGAGEITLGVYDRGFHMLTRDLKGWRVLEDMAGWIADRHAFLFSGAQIHALERLTHNDQADD